MASDYSKGIALGLLIQYFLVGPILGLFHISGVTPFVVVGAAIYLFFFMK